MMEPSTLLAALGIVVFVMLTGVVISKIPIIGPAFDFVAEISGSFPWVYRGWLYIFSKTYREEMKFYYVKDKRSATYKVFDVFLSVLFMVAEVCIVSLAIAG